MEHVVCENYISHLHKKLLRLNQRFPFSFWSYLMSKSPAIPFSQVSAYSFRLINIGEWSRSLLRIHCLSPDMFCMAFSHAKPPPKHPRSARGNFIPILKITRDELPMEQGMYGGCLLCPFILSCLLKIALICCGGGPSYLCHEVG